VNSPATGDCDAVHSSDMAAQKPWKFPFVVCVGTVAIATVTLALLNDKLAVFRFWPYVVVVFQVARHDCD